VIKGVNGGIAIVPGNATDNLLLNSSLLDLNIKMRSTGGDQENALKRWDGGSVSKPELHQLIEHKAADWPAICRAAIGMPYQHERVVVHHNSAVASGVHINLDPVAPRHQCRINGCQ
jgi:hypothetical protein